MVRGEIFSKTCFATFLYPSGLRRQSAAHFSSVRDSTAIIACFAKKLSSTHSEDPILTLWLLASFHVQASRMNDCDSESVFSTACNSYFAFADEPHDFILVKSSSRSTFLSKSDFCCHLTMKMAVSFFVISLNI